MPKTLAAFRRPPLAHAGSGCAFTAQNTSLGSDDVDGGVVHLVSPAIDLSSAATADLDYVRWFYNRDTGEESGAFFVAEVSDDDGASWVDLETPDTNQGADTCTARSFALQDHITLTSTVRLRFGAAGGSSAGNAIEAAIDNVAVWAAGDEPEHQLDSGCPARTRAGKSRLVLQGAVGALLALERRRIRARTGGQPVASPGDFREFSLPEPEKGHRASQPPRAAKQGVGIPAIAVGPIEPEQADRITAEGQADCVAMGLKLLAKTRRVQSEEKQLPYRREG